MSQTPSTAPRRAPERHSAERRPAIWPWVVMPLAALALFLTLHTVRRGGVIGHPAARAAAAVSAAPAQ
jgi:hypothetical protein